MNHASLFSGIGAAEYASKIMGYENVFHCEINEFCNKVLKYHYPNSNSHNDIKSTDFFIYRGKIDILTGGFPCQPYSVAGKRKGTQDERHLWPEMLRVIQEVRPTWIVGENVSGLISWNGGLVFHEVQTDLEAEGYEVQPFVLPAAGVNAPHRRDRVFIIAYSKSERIYGLSFGTKSPQSKYGIFGKNGITSNPNSRRQPCEEYGETKSGRITEESISRNWKNFPTQSPICERNDGFSDFIFTETISEKNIMDRSIVIKNAIDSGRIVTDLINGKIYSTRQRGKEGELVELPGCDCNGYIVHNLMYDGIKKQCRAHQIVWISKYGLYDKENFQIDHINRNKKDNRIENLRLVTAKENVENQTRYEGKLNKEQKEFIYKSYLEGDISYSELAEDYKLTPGRIGQIIREQHRLSGITFPKWRNESIKALGNSIVPQVLLQIFKAIEEYNKIK